MIRITPSYTINKNEFGYADFFSSKTTQHKFASYFWYELLFHVERNVQISDLFADLEKNVYCVHSFQQRERRGMFEMKNRKIMCRTKTINFDV